MADRRQITACGTQLATWAKLWRSVTGEFASRYSPRPIRSNSPERCAVAGILSEPRSVRRHGGGRLAIFVPGPTRDLIFPPIAYRIQYLPSVNSTQHFPLPQLPFLGAKTQRSNCNSHSPPITRFRALLKALLSCHSCPVINYIAIGPCCKPKG
jgi:hypothetical protein